MKHLIDDHPIALFLACVVAVVAFVVGTAVGEMGRPVQVQAAQTTTTTTTTTMAKPEEVPEHEPLEAATADAEKCEQQVNRLLREARDPDNADAWAQEHELELAAEWCKVVPPGPEEG